MALQRFGDTFQDVLILGAGSGTDVAAALRHGVRHVDAVEIDPAIIRLGREHHPDRLHSDPRVTVINDDARHFLRTTQKKYDLVVFALIDSLTLQSSFSGVRLESYMFTEESFRAVRDRLKPDGVLVIYNYFPRAVAGRPAGQHGGGGVRRRAARPRARGARVPRRADGGSAARAADGPAGRARTGHRVRAVARAEPGPPAPRDPSIEPATDDWPFLYMRDRHLPRHYAVNSRSCSWCRPPRSCDVVGARRQARRIAAMVLAVLPARRGLHAARDEIDHPVRAVVGIHLGRRLAGDRLGV